MPLDFIPDVGSPGAGTIIEDNSVPFSFSGTKLIDFEIDVVTKLCFILGSRLYITDPKTQTAISRDFTLTFFPNSDRKDGEVYLDFKGKGKLVYTELAVATTGSDAEMDIDDVSNLTFDDPIALLGDIVNGLPVSDIGTEHHMILNPNLTPPETVDTIDTVYPINNGVVLVNQFKDGLFSDDGLKIYGRLELTNNDTFDCILEFKGANI